MATGSLGRVAFLLGLVVSTGAAGCFLSEEETAAGSDRVLEGGDTSNILKSTLVLESGCSAVKVGPRQLLTAARCVAGKAQFATGQTITFKPASELKTILAQDDVLEPVDASADAGAKRDAGDAPSKPANKSVREVTIEEVEVHPSYIAKCKGELCAFGAIGASDAKDIAVIILDADLESVPTIPVDLDTVGQSDTLLVVGSGCLSFDAKPSGVKTFKTIAVPAKSVNHAGSPYIDDPALVTRLEAGYVVTPGVGWRNTEPRICASDIGAPLFRGGQAAVTGVTSNFTTFEAGKLTPVTLHHTKVDTASKVGAWLAMLGVETTHSCSEVAGGCAKKGYDGGMPDTQAAPSSGNGTSPEGDAGELIPPPDAGEADAGPVSNDYPEQGEEAPLPDSSEEEYTPGEENPYEDYDAGPRKKKKKTQSSCSATPGTMAAGGDGMAVVLGLTLAGAAVRRRRSR
jgi:Trypsin